MINSLSLVHFKVSPDKVYKTIQHKQPSVKLHGQQLEFVMS